MTTRQELKTELEEAFRYLGVGNTSKPWYASLRSTYFDIRIALKRSSDVPAEDLIKQFHAALKRARKP